MPIYEYLCERCGKVNEVFQKLNEKPPRKCDECGSGKLAKLVSRSAFQLKGGGWYADLYSSKKPGGADKGASASSGSASTSTPSTAGSTPSATAPAKPAASEKKPAAKKTAGS